MIALQITHIKDFMNTLFHKDCRFANKYITKPPSAQAFFSLQTA